MSNTRHLSEDQIIQAVMDGPQAAEEIRRHLEECGQCRHQADQLQNDLGNLASMAAQDIEVPPRPASFAAGTARTPRRKGLWATAIAGGLAAAAALVLALIPALQPSPNPVQIGVELAVVEQVSIDDDIFWQPEEAFSNFEEYVMAADETIMDKEFLDFVAPEIDESTSQNQVGRKPC